MSWRRNNYRYPHQTGYNRPEVAKFWIWYCQYHNYEGYREYRLGRWSKHPWRWCCTFCDPPKFGFVSRVDGYNFIITRSMPRHFKFCQEHHEHVRVTHGR